MLKKTGFNFIDVPDKAEIMRVLAQIRPPASLFYSNETAFAVDVKAAFPEMDVIIRFWPDEDVPIRFTPQEWITMHAAESRRGLRLYTNNESGLSDAVIGWNLEVAHKAVEFSRKIVCLNPAAGTYDKPDLPRLKLLLELAGLHPDVIDIGLHEYAGGMIISGMYRPEDMDKHIAPLSWPTPSELANLFPFHVGRNRMLVDYCRQENIKQPRFVITETGFDRTGDIASWLNTLIVTPGHRNIDGWKSLSEQWKVWWPAWTPEMAFIKQFQYAETNLWRDVDYALIYCYGNDGDPRWKPFGVDNTNIVKYMEGQPQVVAPVGVPFPPVTFLPPSAPVEIVTPEPPVLPVPETAPELSPASEPDVFTLIATVSGIKAHLDALKAVLEAYNALATLNKLPVIQIQLN